MDARRLWDLRAIHRAEFAGTDQAEAQWSALRRAFTELGIEIHHLLPHPAKLAGQLAVRSTSELSIEIHQLPPQPAKLAGQLAVRSTSERGLQCRRRRAVLPGQGHVVVLE